MLLDRLPRWYVYTSRFDYWYDWKKSYFYSVMNSKEVVPKETYYIQKNNGLIMEIVVLKAWLNGAPAADNSIPTDPAAIVTLPIPKWLTLIGVV